MNKKFIRVLGFGVGLFLAGSLSVNAQKVSFNGERLSLKQAFEKIESVSKYKIAYNTSQLDVNKQVVLNQKNQDVLQILSDLLKGTNCVYQVNDNYIVITLKDDEKVKKIKGTIKDSAGEPIIGANVILKGDATVGSITDIDGNFDLSVPSNATLQVSYIGYNTQDVPIGNKSFLNITLKEDTETLDEVVVVGYGSQKKVNVIGSIASVDSKALESRAVPDVSNMLTGQMSGVTITQESGNPGQDAGTIRIRGVGSFGATPSPLVLVDGLPGSLSDLTPADIDNISVLKDASSAAIYGSRAANGVILVTTKKGKEGKARIIYNGSVGMSQATELPELAHSYEYAEFYNKAIGTETYTPEMIQKYRDGSDPDNYADEMYLDDLLGGHALQTKHELSVSGGTEKVQYMVSLGYLRQNGLLDNNYYNRYNARVNLGAELAKNLKLQVRLSGMTSDRHEPSTPGSLDIGGFKGIISNAVRFPGLTPTYLQNGEVGLGPKLQGTPVAWVDCASSYREDYDKFKNNIELSYQPIDGLTLKILGGYNYTLSHVRHYRCDMILTGDKSTGPSTLSDEMKRTVYKTFQAVADYNKSFGKHNLAALVGYTWEDEGQRTLSGSRNNFPSDDVPFLGAGGADGQTNGGGGYDWAIQSVFGRLTYNYDQRYLFEKQCVMMALLVFRQIANMVSSLLWLQVGVSLKNSFGRKMKICLSLII
jgi:TonB-linked SusC/RagA family outer membrane protein